jgi:hypothetical protein
MLTEEGFQGRLIRLGTSDGYGSRRPSTDYDPSTVLAANIVESVRSWLKKSRL